MYDVLLTPEFREWLDSLEPLVADRVLSVLDRIAEGNWGDYKPLPGNPGIFERRLMGRGPGYRLYFCRQRGNTVVMLTAGDKASQQRRDIGRARRLLEIYQD
ncbi:MAG: type II toxin-antitoxin system RelE/ParE family toxin [Chloroflexi bacterium]|nr:type II toxin-antitoxin system RelE/ParE family toxin [Chloroflexota bacterium]